MDEVITRRKATRVRFAHEDSDYYFMMALAYQNERGAAFGECFQIASRIQEGNAESWVRAWSEAADGLVTQGERCEAEGHAVSARDCYLRASTYYRTAIIFVRVEDPRYRQLWQLHRDCFQKALCRSPERLEAIAIRFEQDIALPGYFMPGEGNRARRPTLIFTSGGESLAEDGYFWCGAAGMRRGYNVVAVELPVHMGARLLNPSLSPAGRGADVVMKALGAILDYTLARDDVDPERVAIVGYSAGSAFAMRAAISNARIKACIADSPIYDMEQLFAGEFPRALLKAPALVGDFFVKVANRHNEMAAIVFERSCWQVGSRNLTEFVRRAGEMKVVPEEISCPMLCLASAGEGKGFIEQAKEVYERLRVPKTLRIFSAEEGADAHCQINNFPLAQAMIFDWLDEAGGGDCDGGSDVSGVR